MLKTQDLVLSKGEFEDWKSLYNNVWSQDETAKFMLWTPIHTEEEAKVRMYKSMELMKHTLSWFIYEKKSTQVIGFAGMKKVQDNVYEDTGIVLGPQFVKKGYGTQVLKLLCDEAFYTYGASKFVCSCRRGNIPSKQLQLSLGFYYTYSVNKVDSRNNESYILDFYELLRD